MRSRLSFSVQEILLGILAIIFVPPVVVAVAAAFFGVRIAGAEAFPLPHGFSYLLSTIPWGLLFICAILVVVGALMIRKTGTWYRTHGLYVVVGLFVLTGITGAVLDYADRSLGINRAILYRAEELNIPLFGSLLEQFRAPPLGEFGIYRVRAVGYAAQEGGFFAQIAERELPMARFFPRPSYSEHLLFIELDQSLASTTVEVGETYVLQGSERDTGNFIHATAIVKIKDEQ